MWQIGHTLPPGDNDRNDKCGVNRNCDELSTVGIKLAGSPRHMSRYLNRTIPFIAGRRIGLSLPRRFVNDLLHFAQQIPSVPMERVMDLSALRDVREQSAQRISWSAIFLKAYAIVCERRPELRRTYLSFPWGHLYEHPCNVVGMAVEKKYQGTDELFFLKISRPERLPLTTLDELIRAHKEADIAEVDAFRRALWFSRLPQPIRRLLWWLALEVDGQHKAYHFGTYGVSAAASLGAAGLHILSPLATTLNYSRFDASGRIEVRITYDHRVFDGGTIARALVELEDVLRREIQQELASSACSECNQRNSPAKAADPFPLSEMALSAPSYTPPHPFSPARSG